MTNQEAVRLIRNLPTMCTFTDAYGDPIDSDAYYEAVDMAISALGKVGDTISKQAAIATVDSMMERCDTNDINDYHDLLIEAFNVLPPVFYEIAKEGKQ